MLNAPPPTWTSVFLMDCMQMGDPGHSLFTHRPYTGGLGRERERRRGDSGRIMGNAILDTITRK